jgi:hypothetical protein
MSLGIKEAIQIARVQFQELLPDLSIQSTDIRLEEIEREGANWAITFSVPNADNSPSLLSGITIPPILLGRVAKTLVVDGTDGKLVALRQRAA